MNIILWKTKKYVYLLNIDFMCSSFVKKEKLYGVVFKKQILRTEYGYRLEQHIKYSRNIGFKYSSYTNILYLWLWKSGAYCFLV